MAADKSQAVQVRGLAEFQRELRKLDLAKDLRLANKEAAEVVASAARARARGGVAAKTAPSVKAAAEQRRAKVTLGGAAYPFAMGAEFGGQGRPTTMQFEPHRGTQGYFLYPAVRDTREQFIDTYARVLDQLMRRAFPN
jgi:hypothetical protein